ncbi:MAG: amidohydrolase [Acidimicrobiia bacterium]
MANPPQPLADFAARHAPTAVDIRRHLHPYPETAWNEIETTQFIADKLSALGLQPHVRPEGTGLYVDVGPGDPVVGFRADLDALGIQEEGTQPYVSQRAGIMHGCGHDVHSAIGYGVAAVLSELDDMRGGVRIVFQPAEESIPGGARILVGEGIHQGLHAMLAYHVDPALEPGKVGLRTGGITSASDRFTVTLEGPGGHTSRPHQTVDMAYAAGKVVVELPWMLRQSVDPREALAIVFGSIEAGKVANVIPTTARLQGTVRVFDMTLWREMATMLEKAVADIVTPLGASFEVNYHRGSPPVINDGAVTAAVREVAVQQLGEDNVVDTHQSLGSEDFAWFLEQVPGSLIRLGASIPGHDVDLHSARFDVDESCIETGMVVGAASMLDLLDSYL